MAYNFLSFRMQDAEDRGRIEINYDKDKKELQMNYWANNPIGIADTKAFQNRVKVTKLAIEACDKMKKRLEADL